MSTGQDLLRLAAQHIGEDYEYGANVPLDDSDYTGPWDCAEFVTWVVRQVTGRLYGCLDPEGDDPDPYTGAWARDAKNGTVDSIGVDRAIGIPGAILLKYRNAGHHIVFSDGQGGTIEAMGTAWGVRRGKADGRGWNYGILIPEVVY